MGGVEQLGANDRPGPEIAASAIADAIQDPGAPLRIPVGGDAEMVLAMRAGFNDETFEPCGCWTSPGGAAPAARLPA